MQRYLSFNTSHVTLYHLCLRTAMVIITFQYISCYSLSWSVRRRQYHLCPFQYISCYSLSYHKRIGRYVVTGFQYISCYSLSNLLIMKRYCKNMFQYISCYSLSGYSFLMRKQFPVSIHLMLLFIAKQLPDGRFSDEFQYISYYSLSITIQNQFGFQYSFNTSHVTLYRLSYRNSYQLHLGFNTSHVTLYHSCFAGAGANCSKFQYISLYHPC